MEVFQLAGEGLACWKEMQDILGLPCLEAVPLLLFMCSPQITCNLGLQCCNTMWIVPQGLAFGFVLLRVESLIEEGKL